MLKLMLLLGLVATGWSICTDNPCTETVAIMDGERVDALELNRQNANQPTEPETAGVFGGMAGPARAFLESRAEEAAIRRAIEDDEKDAAKRVAGSAFNPTYVDTCPEIFHSAKVWWVKDLYGHWVPLVHNVGNSQFISWVSCKHAECSAPIVEGNCVTRSKYHRALVWKRLRSQWVRKFVWVRLPGSCECEAKLFPDVPW